MGAKQPTAKQMERSAPGTNPWRSASFKLPVGFGSQDVYEILHSLSLSHLIALGRDGGDAPGKKLLTTQLGIDLGELLQYVFDKHPDKLIHLHKMLQHKGVRICNVEETALQVFNDTIHSRSPQSGRRSAREARVFHDKHATAILLKLEEDHQAKDAYVYVDVVAQEKPNKRHSCPLEQLDASSEEDCRGFLKSDGDIDTSRWTDLSHVLFLSATKCSQVRIETRNIIVMGQTGAGKTSSIHNLVGRSLPVCPTSTELAEISPDVFSQDQRSFKFEPILPEDHVVTLSRSILPHVLEATGQTTPTSSSVPLKRKHSPSSPVLPTKNTPSQLMETVRERVSCEVTKASLRMEVDLKVDSSELSTLSLCQFIDCGGLPFFRNFLPQFFPSTGAVFLLVHNLMDKLLHSAQVRVLQDGQMVHSRKLPISNIQEILNWIHIIHSCCQTTTQCSPSHDVHNAFIVGTHFDQLLHACYDNHALATEAAKIATEFICHHVVGRPCGQMLDPEPVFLDNTLAGTERCSGVGFLRQKLKSLVPTTIVIPTLWAALLLHLKEAYKDRGQASVITLTTFFSIAATKFMLEKAEAEKALEKFQEMCLVFRMPSQSYLSQFIFTDMQWLFNAFASILNPPESYCKQGRYYQEWLNMMTTGFMSEQLHSHIFSKAPQSALLPSHWISDFFEHLHLLAKITSLRLGTRYFCPILLTPFGLEKPADDPFRCQTQVEPLYLRPVSGSIPPGFHARLFTILSRRSDLSPVVCCSQVSATFELCNGVAMNERFFVRISEEQDAIKLEFCNTYSSVIDNTIACNVATCVVAMVIQASRSIKEVWIHSREMEVEFKRPVVRGNRRHRKQAMSSSRKVPCMFLSCQDPDCLAINGHHLAKAHPLPLNRERPYVQCTRNQRRQYIGDLPPSQLIWLWDIVEDEGERDLMQESLFFVIIGEDENTQTSNRSTFPLSRNTRIRKGIVKSDKKASKQWFSSTACHGQMIQRKPPKVKDVPESNGRHRSFSVQNSICMMDSTAKVVLPTETLAILDRHFELFYKHLDLKICYQLFEMNILTDDELKAICEEAEDTADIFTPSLQLVPNPRRKAVKRILDAARRGGEHGFMGLMVCLEINSDKENPNCSHSTILNALKWDSEFSSIEERWLKSLTIGTVPCPAHEYSPAYRSPS